MNLSRIRKLFFLHFQHLPMKSRGWIEQLKHNYPIDGGMLEPANQLEENYRTSNFHYLEERLKDVELYNLE